jgi:preprotein translocase subunit SecD
MSKSIRLLVAVGATALGCVSLSSRAAPSPACTNAGWVVVESKASHETRTVKAGPKRSLFVRRTQITTTADLSEIKLAGDAYDMEVQMKFTPEAARRLHDATTNKDGLHIAFVVDDKALSAVTWTGPYGMDADSGVQISLGKAIPEVRPLVASIQSCIGSNAK